MLVFFVWKLIQLVRMVRLILPLQITAEQLKSRMDAGETIGIVDLLRFEDDPREWLSFLGPFGSIRSRFDARDESICQGTWNWCSIAVQRITLSAPA